MGANIFSSKGTTRRTFKIWRWALKFARNRKGRRCNHFEFDLFQRSIEQRRQMLCPALWVSPLGLLLIQAAACPLEEMMSLDEYLAIASRWRDLPDYDEGPFEPKASDWGWHKGRLVALDYANHESLYEPRDFD